MENFIEFKEAFITQAMSKDACKDQVERAKECQTWEELKVVIANNVWWLVQNEVKLHDDHYKSNTGS